MPSQLGQDLFVLEVLGGLHGGFFLDSGAADGVRVSNTLLLENSFGWRGICIEPNEVLFAALKANRRCHCVNSCLYDREGTVDFLEASTLGGILDEYHPAHLQFVRSSFPAPFDDMGKPKAVKRRAQTIRSVLREYAAPPVIDYWSLDTEGSELSILRSFPFGEYSFRVLTVEHNRLPVRDQIREFLETKGYYLAREMGIDDCYVKDIPSAHGAWRSAAWATHRFRCLSTL
jgi:FkbM family methyltransferase